MGARASRARRHGRRDGASRASHPHRPAERARAAGAARARARAWHGTPRHDRRELLTACAASIALVARCVVAPPLRRTRSACSSRWTTRSRIISRRTASRTTRSRPGVQAEWLLNYRGGSFLLPDTPELRRQAALDGITDRADRRRAARADPRARSPASNMESGAAREGAEDRRLHAARRAAVGRRGHARAQVRRHRVHADLRRRGRARRPVEVRLAAPAPRGFHRAAQQVLSHAIATRPGSSTCSQKNTATAQAARLREHAGAQEGRRREDPRSSSSAADSCSRCAARRRRSSWRSPATNVDIAQSFTDGTPMDPDADREDGLEAHVRLPATRISSSRRS